ncbi:MAG: YciI family protein [Erythrobacter sp.]|jgi:uncharacterized protein YciI|nr:YciI family protein [Erythrobacter sp.]
MTLFGFYCLDADDGASLREKLLRDHLAHVAANIEDFAVAGPLKDGERTIGSLVIVKAENEAEARAKFEADPYHGAGVWKSVQVSRFLAVAGDWVGGIGWKG